MFIKAIISFILGPLIALGGMFGIVKKPVAPPVTPAVFSNPETKIVSNILATRTQAATTSPKIKKEVPIGEKIKKIETPIINNAVSKQENPIVIPPTTPEPAPDFEKINTFARLATVNIFCASNGNGLSTISGTGVIVDPRGLIFTNAHIAQYLLLKDFRQTDSTVCTARTGSPAYPKYHLELVYISPTWVASNKTILKEQDPKGTGENDFAFLRITDSIDGTKLSDSFSFVPPNIREVIDVSEPVLLVSYPAGFLGGLTILQNLNVTSGITTIQDIFTFKENTIDLLAVPGTVVSQKGSSGGLVVDKNATLIGMITTSSEETATSDRRLNAITTAYINRTLQNELGITLSQFLSQDLVEFAKEFQKTNIPNLTKLITDELNKR